MKKRINKIVKLNLKNAIVIRTNLKPFEINKGSIDDFVRGIWRCNPPKNIKYVVGAIRIITGKAKIIGVWEIDEILTVTKNFKYTKWPQKVDWSKLLGRKIFIFKRKIRNDLDDTVFDWLLQTPIRYTNSQGNLETTGYEIDEEVLNYFNPEDRRNYFISRELRKTTGKGWEQLFLSRVISKFKYQLEPLCQYYQKEDNQRILIDLYYHQINLAIEIDEPFHQKNQKKDALRQDKIIKNLGCKVYRLKIDKGNFENQINKLFNLINDMIKASKKKIIWNC
jgi:very-short-patch-repair endonuclease